MNPRLVGGVWALVTLDCALMGYRLAMGRSAVLGKRRYHRIASLRAGLVGQIPILAMIGLALVLAHQGGPTVTTAFDSAMGRFIQVGGSYAALIFATWAFCLFQSVTVRTIASVFVFGPFTLLRPVVVVAVVVFALGPDPPPALLLMGLMVVVPGVGLEPILDRRIATQLLAPPPCPSGVQSA